MAVEFLNPYAEDGFDVAGAALRREKQQNAGEGSGICSPADLRVSQLNPPGRGFTVAPGDDVAQSRRSGRERESYGVSLLASGTYMGDGNDGIPGSPSNAGRRDMIIHEIVAPSAGRTYTPRQNIPEGVLSKITVVPGVAASARKVEDVPALANVTAVALAAINWPPNQEVIQGSYIEDLRVVQNPKRDEFVYARPRVSADNSPQNYLVSSLANGGEYFPGGGGYANQFQVDVPIWCTRMVLDARWMAVNYGKDRRPVGRFWLEFGDEFRDKTWPNKGNFEFRTQEFKFNASRNEAGSTIDWSLADEVPVPAKLRGKRITIVFKAAVENVPGANHTWMDALSGLTCRGTFAQHAIGPDLL